MTGLAPLARCLHRQVTGDGRILCGQMAGADREVTLDLCHACPARAISCSCLRFTLQKRPGGAILVRQRGGESYLLEGEHTAPTFRHAACAARAVPITSADDCRGCVLRPAPGAAAHRTSSRVIPFPGPMRRPAEHEPRSASTCQAAGPANHRAG